MKTFNTYFKTFFCCAILAFCLTQISAQTIETIAGGFTGVNGLTLDTEGNLWVAETGTGNDDGKIKVITPDKAVYDAIISLPSYFDTLSGDTPGAWRAYRNGNFLDVIIGGGIHPDAGALLHFDISGWSPGDAPLSLSDAAVTADVNDFITAEGYPESDPYRVAWDDNGNAYVVDAGANAVVKYDAGTGALSVVHEFPPYPNIWLPFPPFVDYVPTAIVRNPAGGFYVCNLTGFPFPKGLSTVVKMDESGNVTPFADSLNFSVEMDVDAQGNLYVLQLGDFDTTFAPIPFAAKITKITPSGEKSVFTEGFTPVFSSGMVLDGNGGVYVNDLGLGTVMHISFPSAANELALPNLKLVSFPNPTVDFISIQFKQEKPGEVTARLFSCTGNLVWRKELGLLPASTQEIELDLRGQSSGLYFIQITTPNQTAETRVIRR
ncbi:MAG: ScyD/ScyE family protein [Bacteroidetes bacterium]|nr:ScyD/ScyE family protein [Bacteroidota bacterium]